MNTPRISMVDTLNIKSVVLSSIANIGDSKVLRPRVKVFAVQRVYPLFHSKEGEFMDYPAYSKPIPHLPDDRDVDMTIFNETPVIRVHHVNVIGLSASSIIQIGTNQQIDSEARVKHFRQL